MEAGYVRRSEIILHILGKRDVYCSTISVTKLPSHDIQCRTHAGKRIDDYGLRHERIGYTELRHFVSTPGTVIVARGHRRHIERQETATARA